jgi:multicomponent Na+:H+ antiporter subunit B
MTAYPILTLDVLLLVLVAATGIAVINVRSLLSATILAGIYSLLMALVWTNMHALDVAFTEAAVGAGISTVLMLGALVLTKRFAKKERKLHWPAAIICVITGLLLCYGTLDMPVFGDPTAPIHTYRVPELMNQTVRKHESAAPRDKGHAHEGHPDDDFNGHVPNTVTSLLAAYRGYDTMYETTVIFVAGTSMLLLLRRRREGEPGVETSSPEHRMPDDRDGKKPHEVAAHEGGQT